MIEISGFDVWLWGLMFYVIGLGLGYLFGMFRTHRHFTKSEDSE